jgi:energy-coupling factor transport system permease protein
MAITDVHAARRLRGRPTRGLAGLRGTAVPVLERALDRSLQLASSMDARGYGRRVPVARGARRTATAATAGGLLLVVAGVYGVLVAGSLPGGGIPFVAVGAVLVGAGLAVGGRRTNRTRYRPDPWRLPEWLVSASGAVAVGVVVGSGILGVPGLEYVLSPLALPTLPVAAAIGILVGIAPAWVAPVERVSTVVRSGPPERPDAPGPAVDGPAEAAGQAPSTDAPSTGAPSTGAPSTVAPSTGEVVAPAVLPGGGSA